jgi:hypothetical protein
LRAKRSNPEGNKQKLDCFVARAPRNDGEMVRLNKDQKKKGPRERAFERLTVKSPE